MDPHSNQFERLRRLMTGSCVRPLVHDVNNLLGAAMAYTELAQMDPGLDAKSHRQLGEAVTAIQRCSDLMNAFAQLVRPVKRTSYSLNEVVAGTTNLRAHALRAQSIILDVHYPEETHLAEGTAAVVEFAILCMMLDCERRLSGVDGPRNLYLSVSAIDTRVGVRISCSAPPETQTRLEPNKLTALGLDLPELSVQTARELIEAEDGHLMSLSGGAFLLTLPSPTREPA